MQTLYKESYMYKKPPTRSRGFREIVRKIVSKSDLVVEILDARDPFGTRNTELERLVSKYGKALAVVVNKADLVRNTDSIKIRGACILSSRNMGSAKILKKFLLEKLPRKPARVAIVGYPNVGKSTIINMLKGRRSASVAPIPGHTRGMQWIRIDEDMLLLDSPGIIPSYEKDETLLAEKGAIEADHLKDPEHAAQTIIGTMMRNDPYVLEKFYDIEISVSDSPQEVLERIAIRRGRLLKGSVPDILSVSKSVIRDRYKGKI